MKAGTYYLSCGNVVHGGVNAPWITFEDETSSVAYASLEQGMKKEIQLKKDCQFIALYSNGYDYYGSAGFTATVEDLMLVASNEIPGGYTPYIGQTNTMTLPETVYGGEVDAVTGEGQETWEIIDLAKANISLSEINQHGIANFSLAANLNNIHTTPGTADYFTSSLPKDTALFNDATKIGIFKANASTFYIRLKETDANNEGMAKAYLASINAKLVYKLATPTSFTATGAQPLPALKGTNTVLTDADSATVTGRADPIKRIEDLEAAVASIN